MNAVPDRRRGHGRRRADRHADELRTLIHDIGHAVAAMGYLVDSALSDGPTAAAVNRKLELVRTQTRTLTALIERAIQPAVDRGLVEVRSILTQLSEQADATGPARVVLTDGPEVTTDLDGVVLWRILSNLIGNAARAAGRDGTVSVAITGVAPIVIEIADDGPGFGVGEPGWASLGLAAVRRLSWTFGADVTFESRVPVGTLTRVTLAARGDDEEGATGEREIS